MKKSKITSSGEAKPEIPAEAMARLRRAFQAPSAAGISCPEPEQIIRCSLNELEAQENQQVQAHLLTCRDCLDLYLDVSLAQAEAALTADGELDHPLPDPHKPGVWAAWGSRAREIWQVLVRPRRLLPALAAASLMLLVVILGREEPSRVLPPSQLARERQAAPTAPRAAPPQETAAAKPGRAEPGSELLASKRKFESEAPIRDKSSAARGTLAESKSIRLALKEVAAPAGSAVLAYGADRDAFAYLLRQDSSGTITLLFSGRIEGGRTYVYPAKDQDANIDLAGAPATVYLIAATEPLTDLPTRIQRLQREGGPPSQSLFPGATIRAIKLRHP